MSRSAKVYHNNLLAGILVHDQYGYSFSYTNEWFHDSSRPAISLTFPKSKQTYESENLFPFFSNLLSEGVNRKLQARQLQIDEKDDFGILLATAGKDTIGAVTLIGERPE